MKGWKLKKIFFYQIQWFIEKIIDRLIDYQIIISFSPTLNNISIYFKFLSVAKIISQCSELKELGGLFSLLFYTSDPFHITHHLIQLFWYFLKDNNFSAPTAVSSSIPGFPADLIWPGAPPCLKSRAPGLQCRAKKKKTHTQCMQATRQRLRTNLPAHIDRFVL